MVGQGVRNYLLGTHSGALLISGAWGSGKSYYVKNTLLDAVKGINFKYPEAAEGLSSTVVNLLKESGSDICNHFEPVMVSVFGMNSIADIEHSIVSEWIDNVTHGLGNKFGKLVKGVNKVWNNSKKLKDFFDISSVLQTRPSLKSLPKNVVIILDDLERFEEKISETEMLGFVNNLVENLGFKVILIANEGYLSKAHSKQSTFKEKVIGKTVLFMPDSLGVVNKIINELGDDEFSNFMRDDRIQNSLNRDSAFAKRYDEYAQKLTNLRTLKFAVSHFFFVFNAFRQYVVENGKMIGAYEETLLHAWFFILAVSIEYKVNHILTDDLRGLDEYCYLNHVEIDFGDDVGQSAEELFAPTNPLEDDSDKKEKDNKEKTDGQYTSFFFQFYFLARQIGLQPITSPHLLNFVIRGADVSPEAVIEEYQEGKKNLHAPGNKADEELSYMIHHFISIGNEEFVERLTLLFEDCKNGSFSGLTSFVNASVYLFVFGPQLIPKDEDSIYEALKTGIDKWVESHALHDIYTIHLKAMAGSVEGEWPKKTLRYALNSLKKKEEKNNMNAERELIALFSEDIRKFCAELCPRAFDANAGNGIGFFERNPILHKLPEDDVRKAIRNITISDASALKTLFHNRYSIIGIGDLKPIELSFWETVYEEIGKYGDNMTAGKIQAQHTMFKPLEKFLGIKPPSQENKLEQA